MKLIYLSDSGASRDVVAMATIEYANSWRKVVALYPRSLNADELVLVSDEMARFDHFIDKSLLYDFDLKSLGVHPRYPSYQVCSRTDSGPFWRVVALTKYKALIVLCWMQAVIHKITL